MKLISFNVNNKRIKNTEYIISCEGTKNYINIKKTQTYSKLCTEDNIVMILKGILHPKMNILSLIIYPHVVPNPSKN